MRLPLINLFYFVAFFLATNGYLYSQNSGFDFDYARFRATDSTTLCEFYYQFDKSKFNSGKSDSVKLLIHLFLISNYENQIEKIFKVTDVLDSASVSKSAVGKFDIEIPNSNYYLLLKVTDLFNPEKKIEITDSLFAEGFPKQTPALSDVELAFKIEKTSKTKSPFYKNTYNVIPNPTGVYSYLNPTVYYYYEIYNIEKTQSDSLLLITELLNGNGKLFYTRKKKIPKSNNYSLVKVSQLVMNNFPTGSYSIKISVADLKGKYAYSSIKKFYYLGKQLDNKNYVSSINASDVKFAGLSNAECDKMFREVQYLATRKEKADYQKLNTLEQKKRFLAVFWNKRDRKPDTPENEFMNEYFKRLKYVNKVFGTKVKKGYLTDRGRVYLLYGKPDEIDRYPYSLEYKPYEIWYYHSIEGGVVFVFGDLSGYGDYQLLHSTKRGELYNSTWRERIRVH